MTKTFGLWVDIIILQAYMHMHGLYYLTISVEHLQHCNSATRQFKNTQIYFLALAYGNKKL